MKKLLVIILLFTLAVVSESNIKAQCSDAGICQMGLFLEEESILKNNLGLRYSYGYSGKDDDIQYSSAILSGNSFLLDNTSISFLLPYNSQSGPLGKVRGIGDLIVSVTQNFQLNEASNIALSLGGRFATGDANKDPDLPQQYQSSLGSNDLLLGVQYNLNEIQLGMGYQVAGSRNNNAITRLERGDDFLLRGGYYFGIDNLSITPQLLVIKRLSESSVLDTTSTEENFVYVEGSDQLQINFLLNAEYKFTKSTGLVFEFAFPFLKREVNVDGLTRALTLSLGLLWHF